MSTQATADLLAEVQALIHEREREGVLGLAELIGPAEWADLVPQLEPSEVAVLIQWLPDEEIGEILEELPPTEAARILRTLSAPEASQLLGVMDPDDAAVLFRRFTGSKYNMVHGITITGITRPVEKTADWTHYHGLDFALTTGWEEFEDLLAQ